MRARQDFTVRTRRDLDALNPYARGRDRPRLGRIRLDAATLREPDREALAVLSRGEARTDAAALL